MLKICFYAICLSIAFPVFSHADKVRSWGDQGDGTYKNPVLNADYSDPDVIRVGKKYYMVCSEFHFMGMNIQESDDMVNWRIIGRVYTRLDFERYDQFKGYAKGSWAPALRYHDHKFWIFFCTPSEGLFMTNAAQPEGPWAPLTVVRAVRGWEDPCPFWDDDGKAYLARSKVGAGPIIVHEMSPDGTRLLDEGKEVYRGPVAEGSKVHKWNGYYYMSIPEGGVRQGWQTVLRSRNIWGPYEKKKVLEKGTTRINGPHQGSIVETPAGEWWFYHFQYVEELGRVLHLQPMVWQDGWPVIGQDFDGNGVGEPVAQTNKPNVGATFETCVPASSDAFESAELGLQWQWNHNPDQDGWSLSERKGWLMLQADHAQGFYTAKNTLTQKTMGYTGVATVVLDASAMADGQKAGLALFSKACNSIGLRKEGSKLTVFYEQEGDGAQQQLIEEPINTDLIYLKVVISTKENSCHVEYSLDNERFKPIGESFSMHWGYWKGPRFGLFTYNTKEMKGKAFFSRFTYEFD